MPPIVAETRGPYYPVRWEMMKMMKTMAALSLALSFAKAKANAKGRRK